jgi:hypothetical protein
MGRKAKLRAKRREPLPRYIDSPRFGLIDTEDYQGCQVLFWDFDKDQPRALLNHKTKQVHMNTDYLPADLNLELLKNSINQMDEDIQLTNVEYTNF